MKEVRLVNTGNHQLKFANICLLILLPLSSCSYLNKQDPDLNLPEPQLSTTSKGALTGAAIGAGLGLAIGASSGNAGEGLAMGTIAGAAAGGVIGNVMERQDKKKRQEIVQEQDSVIEEQQMKINELKKTREDKARSTQSKTSKSAIVSNASQASSRAMLSRNYNPKSSKIYVKEGYKGNPRAQRFSLSDDVETTSSKSIVENKKAQPVIAKQELSKTAKSAEITTKKPAEDKAKLAATTRVEKKGTTIKTEEVKTKPAVVTKEGTAKTTAVSALEAKNDSGLPPARSVASNTATGTIGEETQDDAEEAVTEAVKTVSTTAQPATQVAAVAPAVETLPKTVDSAAKKAPADPACSNAEQEAIRARNSSSDADRLFYLRRAARLCPSFAGYHVEIGQIYTQLGRKEDARFALGKALELDPDNASAKERLNILNQ
ncbi:MAG: tetratricopeptide repeat protein [Deltaproteobacteria bacterium]|nr:tetratricopeptide repeat protein [Deltaproteobacteria bacterium]